MPTAPDPEDGSTADYEDELHREQQIAQLRENPRGSVAEVQGLYPFPWSDIAVGPMSVQILRDENETITLRPILPISSTEL